jgi:Predicted nucleotide-binding protein containing TIR-like domain
MPEQLLKRCEELMISGTQLTPQGGFEASGYNARLQNKYLDWRKACLETIESSGPIGFPYKQKILGDKNSGFFFQPSAQLILNCMRELYEKIKASPDLATAPPAPAKDIQTPAVQTATDTGGVRILKPPPKPAAPQSSPVTAPAQPPQQPIAAAQPSKVYVIGEADDPLYAQLLQFLREVGLEEINLERQHGQMLSLETLQMDGGVKFAFFVINSDDLTYAMFEIGHFVGKLGKNRVCVIHMSDVSFPKNVPGVLAKPIVVKLEEASLGILRELKAAGCQINL